MNYLHGQGYYSTAVMSGHFNSVQGHIIKSCLLAYYIHFSSHSLNLAISGTRNIQFIRNYIVIIQFVFLRYPKINNILKESISSLCPASNVTRSKLLCSTRWMDRHDSILVFLDLLDTIIDSLTKILFSLQFHKDFLSGAYQLLC